jgi:P pilus assembly chaperone PapD
MRLPLALLVLGSIPRLASAQGVLVAPHAIYMDHRTRSGSVTLYNPGNDAVEVSLSTMFGYPVTDSAGDFLLRTVEDPDSTLPSASRWIQAFPRRMTLGPQERQTVRLLGKPPAGLPDGEYWARLVVSAKGGAVPVSGVADTGSIQVGLTLEVRTILPMLYRKGKVATGLAMSRLHAAVERDSLAVRAHLARQGSAAFVGTVAGALIDSTGKAVGRFKLPSAVYLETDPRFTLPVTGLAAGRYRLRIEITSEREDLPSDVILPITPVRDSVEVRLP